MIELIAGSIIGLISLTIIFKLLTDLGSVAFDLVVCPVSLGILASLSVYFILPGHMPQASIVAYVTDTLLDWAINNSTNLSTETPSYIARTNLEAIAIAAGAISYVVLLLIGLVKTTLVYIGYRAIHLAENLKRNKKVKLNMSAINKHAKNRSDSYEVVYAQGDIGDASLK